MRKKYNWKQFSLDIDKIVKWMEKFNFKNIYGIPRGGLIPAVAISHKSGVPIILKEEEITGNTLVVDDILDSGKTIQELNKRRSVLVFVTLFKREETLQIIQIYYNCRLSKSHWIVFPWETDLSSKYDNLC